MDNRLVLITKLYYNDPSVRDNTISDPNCIMDMDLTQLVLLMGKVFGEEHYCFCAGCSGTSIDIETNYVSIYEGVFTNRGNITIVSKDAVSDAVIDNSWVEQNCKDHKKTALYCLNILTLHINAYNLVSMRNSLTYYMMFNQLNTRKESMSGRMFINYLFYNLKEIACRIKDGGDITDLVNSMNYDYGNMLRILNELGLILDDLEKRMINDVMYNTPFNVDKMPLFINEYLVLQDWINDKKGRIKEIRDKGLLSFIFNEMKFCIEIAEDLIGHIISLTSKFGPAGVRTVWNEQVLDEDRVYFSSMMIKVERDLKKLLEDSGTDKCACAERYIEHLDLLHNNVLSYINA